MYNLVTDGDGYERKYWGLFIQREFPSYEKFWQKFVVPLTNRPTNLYFKTDTELGAIGKGHEDLCLSQLNYSALLHLVRCFEIKSQSVDMDQLTEGLVRLVGCQDIAFELLERISTPSAYTAWSEDDGKRARTNWQRRNGHPLQNIRDYRNRLVHGRLLPSVWSGQILLPNIGKEDLYIDWRLVTDPQNNLGMNMADLSPMPSILAQAWKETIAYLETQWQAL